MLTRQAGAMTTLYLAVTALLLSVSVVVSYTGENVRTLQIDDSNEHTQPFTVTIFIPNIDAKLVSAIDLSPMQKASRSLRNGMGVFLSFGTHCITMSSCLGRPDEMIRYTQHTLALLSHVCLAQQPFLAY